MDGLLIIDKPEGLTSHDVVARVRRMLKTKRVGQPVRSTLLRPVFSLC